MNRLLSISVEVIAAAVVLIPALLFLEKRYFHNPKKSLVYLIFTLYFAAVYVAAGLPTVTYFRPDISFNLVPFVDMIPDYRNAILNIILFVPLGIMLPRSISLAQRAK